jgi:hypothetical protein
MSARTYVVCARDAPQRVVGYNAISTAMEQRITLPNARIRRALPDQVPLLLIGRLAVDRQCQGKGLGEDLLFDGVRRCLEVSEIAGIRAVITHAIDDDAVRFYEHGPRHVTPAGRSVFKMQCHTRFATAPLVETPAGLIWAAHIARNVHSRSLLQIGPAHYHHFTVRCCIGKSMGSPGDE